MLISPILRNQFSRSIEHGEVILLNQRRRGVERAASNSKQFGDLDFVEHLFKLQRSWKIGLLFVAIELCPKTLSKTLSNLAQLLDQV